MAPEPDIVPVSAGEVAPAAQVIARAFFTEPLAVLAFPDETTRMGMLIEFFEWRVRYARRYAHAWRPPGAITAAALVLEPDAGHYSNARMADSGYATVTERLGAEADRAGEAAGPVFRVCDEAAERTCDPADWEIQLIGVDPAAQGTGVGGRLIDAIHRRADAAGAGMRLFTLSEANLRFYTHHGYAVVADGREPSSGLGFWVLRRQARVHSAPEL